MSARRPARQHGGVSRHIDFVRSSLLLPSTDDSPAKPGAVLEVGKLIGVMIDQARAGDSECGYFLAELTVYLQRAKQALSNANPLFHETLTRLESGRDTTKRSSPLRPLIQCVIVDSIREKRLQEISKLIPEMSLVIKRNKTLLQLPEFSPEPAVVSTWTEKLVYPKLRSIEPQLKEHSIIGILPKALDENGKFHVSRLKTLIGETTARIAKLPKVYHFNLWSVRLSPEDSALLKLLRAG
jgi:hypothetical protein